MPGLVSPTATSPSFMSKTSPMSLILDQGGRVRRVELSGKGDGPGSISTSTGAALRTAGRTGTTGSTGSTSSTQKASSFSILEWTPSQVGAWLANDVGLPHLVPKFISEAVDGQLLLTLTDADLAGELGMMDTSRGDDDYKSVERKQVLTAIAKLRIQNKENRKQRKNKQTPNQSNQSNSHSQQKPEAPQPSTSSSTSLACLSSPSHLERRLSQLQTDSERVEVLTQELLAMQTHHSTLRAQHTTMSKHLEREKEQSKAMREKHQEERIIFERKTIEAQRNASKASSSSSSVTATNTMAHPTNAAMFAVNEIPSFQAATRHNIEDPAAAAAATAAATAAALKEQAAKEKKQRLRAMFAVNEIPSFHTVRPPKGLVKKHEPPTRTSTEHVQGILKQPTFSSSPTRHAPEKKDSHKKLSFLPPEENSLAIIPRVDEEQNEELWWTMEDLDRSSAEADQESMVEELEALEELRLKQGGQLTPQQQQTENELRGQLAQAQQEQHMQQMQMQLELQGYDLSQMDPEMQQQLLMSIDPMMAYGMVGLFFFYFFM